MSLIKITLTDQTTPNEVIEALDKSGVGIVPLVDEENKLIGIVTDGDVRRAVLKGNITIDSIVNRSPKTLLDRVPKSVIIKELRERHLRHMPLVNESGHFVDIVFLENLSFESKSNTVVIMAGGLGSRLGGLTKDVPKPMLPVGGKPILEHILVNMKAQGFKSFTICLNYKADVIRDHFGDGSDFGVSISYTLENQRLGTAGALSLIDFKKTVFPCIVLNADIITSIDFDALLRFHSQSGASATMCVKPQEHEIPFACVEFDESYNLLTLAEKPKMTNFINAGIYVLGEDVVKQVPKGVFYDMPTLFQDTMVNGFQTKVFMFEEYWIDIGRPHDYSKANNELG